MGVGSGRPKKASGEYFGEYKARLEKKAKIQSFIDEFCVPMTSNSNGINVDDIVDKVFPPDIEFNPVQWAEDHGIHLTNAQKELLRSVVDNKRTAARACHEVGKSFAVSVLMLCWIDTYKYDSFVLWTAPTYPQVDAIIGRELRTLQSKLKLDDIEVLENNEIKYRGRMVGQGRKPAEHNKQGFSGLHARHPLVILDEGGSLSQQMFDSAETVIGNENGRLVTIGNPDNPIAYFRGLFKPESSFHQIKIDAYHSPNFTEEQTEHTPLVREYMKKHNIPYSTEWVPDELRDVLFHPSTAEEWIMKHGVESAYVASKINAEFPESSADSVFPYELIENATGVVDNKSKPRCLSVDVGAGGVDETAAYSIRKDGSVILEFVEPQSDLMRLSDRISRWWHKNQDCFVVVDANGIGEGVYSRLKQLGVRVRGFYSQTSARDSKTYVNARSEAAFQTARAMQNNLITIDLHDDQLRSELPSISKKMDNRNRYKLVGKQEMKEQGIASPNRVDALTMAVWELKLGVVRSKRLGLARDQSLSVRAGGYSV